MNHCLVRLLAGSVLAAAVACAWGAEPDNGAIRFDISRFDVQGNTLLAPARIEQLLAPFTGKGRDFGDVQRALEALEGAYHALGYNVVSIELPEQELNRGVVQFKVVQTRVGRVKLQGNQYFDEANIRRSLPALREGQTPNLKDVSAGLKLANDNPSKKVNLKLASGENDDEVDATLDVTDERLWRAMVNLDNSGTEQTGKTHASFIFQHANLWGLDHVASLQYTTTLEEPGRVKVYGAAYHIPLYRLGDALDFYASYSNVDSGNVQANGFDLAVTGKGAVYGGRYTQTLAKRGEYESRLAYGLDYKAFKNNVQYAGTQLGGDVTVHPLSLAYIGSWTMARGELGGSATLIRNVSGGSHGGTAEFERARSRARTDYTIVRLGGSYSRALANEWQLRAIANAQYTGDALIPGEQFGAGGASSVRGFAEREISNDSGASLNLEAYTPNLCGQRQNWNCRLLGFYDIAYLSRNKALAGEVDSTSISSVGLGLRFLIGSNVNLQMDYGHVLKAGATQRVDANRMHIRLALAY
ncbi:ShlB/FhaC/HecB family hemolysin secretion/activation protein [Oxalobacteraceae bacterium]|nr:ShlB/FhaC/HecB family hemolysin secretion/activation protein [Oxalobacteraceae bacterium]